MRTAPTSEKIVVLNSVKPVPNKLLLGLEEPVAEALILEPYFTLLFTYQRGNAVQLLPVCMEEIPICHLLVQGAAKLENR